MKKILLLTLLMIFTGVMALYAHDVVVGQSYDYEWTIINFATGAVISSGSGTVIPTASRGYRNIEHYIRTVVLGWNSRTRTIDGVRQRIVINLLGEEACET